MPIKCEESMNKINLKNGGRKETVLLLQMIKVWKSRHTKNNNNNSKWRHTSVDPHKERFTYPSLMCSLHKFCKVFHLPLSVWILEQDPTDIFSTEVHFMR